jgi:hypothetical protein
MFTTFSVDTRRSDLAEQKRLHQEQLRRDCVDFDVECVTQPAYSAKELCSIVCWPVVLH